MGKIEIFGVIGKDVVAGDIREQLEGLQGLDIEVSIDSPGGNLSEGVLIHNLLRGHSGKVVTVVMARAYSIASYIFMAGDERHVLDNALVMTHEARVDIAAATEGSCDQMKSMLSAANKSIRQRYAEVMGVDEAMIQTLWAASGDLWYTSDEAVQSGLATKVVSAGSELSAEYVLEVMAIAPDHIKNSFNGGALMPSNKVTIEQLEALNAPADFILSQIKAEATEIEAYASFIATLQAAKEEEKDDEKEDEDKDEAEAKDDEKDEEKKDDKKNPFAEGDDEEKDEEKEEAKAEEDSEEEDEAKAEEDDDDKKEEDDKDAEAILKNLNGIAPVAQSSGRNLTTPTQLWNVAVNEKVAAGAERFRAVAMVAKERPQLRQDMINEVNN